MLSANVIITTFLGYVLIGLFFSVVDRRARSGNVAKSMDRTADDAGSTMLLGRAYFATGLVLLAAPFLDYVGIGVIDLHPIVGWMGVLMALLGIALRWWAFRTLGDYYTRILRTSESQHVVQQGPYKLIRHPGYLGSILMWLGAALATANWIALLIAFVVLSYAYAYRIQAEEKMLLSGLGDEYRAYREHSWRLIPFLY